MSYADAVLATPGLLSYHPLDDAALPARNLVPGGPSGGAPDGGVAEPLWQAGAAVMGSPSAAFDVTRGIVPGGVPSPQVVRTLEAWLRVADQASNAFAVACGQTTSATPIFAIGSDSGDHIIAYCRTSTNSSFIPATPGSMAGVAMHHVVATWDFVDAANPGASGTVTLYVDGVEVMHGTKLGSTSLNTARIGYRRATTNVNPFVGDIGHVAFYDRIVTAAEVADHFAAATAGGDVAAAAAFAAAGTLAGSPVVAIPVASAPAAAGALAAAGILERPVAAALAAAGGLTDAPVVVVPVASALAAAGALQGVPAVEIIDAAQITAAGELQTAGGVLAVTAAAAFEGTGLLAATPQLGDALRLGHGNVEATDRAATLAADERSTSTVDAIARSTTAE